MLPPHRPLGGVAPPLEGFWLTVAPNDGPSFLWRLVLVFVVGWRYPVVIGRASAPEVRSDNG